MQGERIEGRYQSPQPFQTEQGGSVGSSHFFTYLPSFGDEQLLNRLEEQRCIAYHEADGAGAGDEEVFLGQEIVGAPLCSMAAL